jgi:hypothetical protein
MNMIDYLLLAAVDENVNADDDEKPLRKPN